MLVFILWFKRLVLLMLGELLCQPPAPLGDPYSSSEIELLVYTSAGIQRRPELIRHDAVLAAVGRAAHTAGGIVGQAEVVSHLVRDGGGQANGAVMVILRQRHTRDVTLCDGSLQMKCESAAPT